ncbi:hypothetical protein Pfo_014233 [Paulownia fortunei]|nr:hypothetical protein Pfo_014233 [Paulownia fortunei]
MSGSIKKMAGKLTLLSFWPSMFCARVRIALEEKGLSYEYREEDLPNKSSLLLEMNPIHKKVPILIHNGKPISESLITVQYIDEVWSDRAPLLPSDPYEKAQARFWADFIDKKVSSQIFILLLLCKVQKLPVIGLSGRRQDEVDRELKGAGRSTRRQTLFRRGDIWFLDIALLGFYMWFPAYETFGNFSIEADCPKLIAWGRRCLQRESVSKSLADPNKMVDVVVHFRKMFGLR